MCGPLVEIRRSVGGRDAGGNGGRPLAVLLAAKLSGSV